MNRFKDRVDKFLADRKAEVQHLEQDIVAPLDAAKKESMDTIASNIEKEYISEHEAAAKQYNKNIPTCRYDEDDVRGTKSYYFLLGFLSGIGVCAMILHFLK